jgi:hypothetical protein
MTIQACKYRFRISCFARVWGSSGHMVCLGAAITCSPTGTTIVHVRLGPLAPLATIEQPTTGLWSQPTPLLEKERNLRRLALITHFTCPFDQHRPGAWPAFTADDHPINASQINFAYWPKKRLD